MARPSYQKVIVTSKPEWFASYTAPTGTPVVVSVDYIPVEVTAVPGNGGSILVETRTTPSGTWVPWTAGAVTEPTALLFEGRCHSMRITAAGADGVVEMAA